MAEKNETDGSFFEELGRIASWYSQVESYLRDTFCLVAGSPHVRVVADRLQPDALCTNIVDMVKIADLAPEIESRLKLTIRAVRLLGNVRAGLLHSSWRVLEMPPGLGALAEATRSKSKNPVSTHSLNDLQDQTRALSAVAVMLFLINCWIAGRPRPEIAALEQWDRGSAELLDPLWPGWRDGKVRPQ